MAHLQQLFRYPVKSLGGEQLFGIALGARGIDGDRVWAVYTEDGGIGSGKTTRRFRRLDGLLHAAARTMADGVPVITLPDGTALRAGDPATDAAMSAWLGLPVTVRQEGATSHFDDAPLHVVTTASVRHLSALLGTPVDLRRFRANLVLDVDDLPGVGPDRFAEDGWTGRELSIGTDVVLRLGDPMPRCVMVSAEQPGVPHDRGVLRTLAAEHDLAFGLMASVVRGGTVREGDRAVLSDRVTLDA